MLYEINIGQNVSNSVHAFIVSYSIVPHLNIHKEEINF